jgi:peptidylprolyl isomerase
MIYRTFSAISIVCISAALSCESTPEKAPEAEPEKPAKAAEPAATIPTPAPEATRPAPNTPAAPEDVAAAPKDAKLTKSGLASKVLTPGSGKVRPTPNDQVSVHYTGWTKDGRMFDSSLTRGTPTTFGVTQVIPGWTEGLQLMVEGEKRRLWIPGKLAYGAQPAMAGAPAGDLVFDVELLSIIKPPEAPKDLKKPPKDAKKTESGLVYKLLTKGSGGVKPKATNTVTVHYSGWTTDGKMFDSSVARGTPASFPLSNVIKGWTEGVQLMVVGDKMRFWIPPNLAYGDKPSRPGAPAGQLVFDVELLAIR